MGDFLAWARNQTDRLAGWVAIGAGALALLLGWVGASAKAFPGDQIPYVISGGLFGLFLLGLGGILLLSADLRDEWSQLERLERALSADQDGAAPGTGAAGQP
ncbi:MAG TPA: hypothetical protein VGR20_00575 [Acidimicrobiia bacterium]|nr:hypothetical protein [Acidimicrobiia bacterium]